MTQLLPLASAFALGTLFWAASRFVERKTGRSAKRPSEPFFAFFLAGTMVIAVVLNIIGAVGLWGVPLAVLLTGGLLLVGQLAFGRRGT